MFNLMTVMEYIGTVAFSVSGTLVAISCGLDLFGVVTVGCITAVGGGILRDLLIGNTPPAIFFKPWILLTALIVALAVFVIAFVNSKRFKMIREKVDTINIFFDALGLAAFSVMGVEAALNAGFVGNPVLSITLGMMTGVGGGVIRDILVNEKPYILTKHIYAVASLVGSGTYFLISVLAKSDLWATVVSVALTVIIRLLAAKFRWKLPKVELKSQND